MRAGTAWAHEGDRAYCLQDGKIFKTNIRNVAAENDFYKLKYLSPDDVDFIRQSVIDPSTKYLKESGERILSLYRAPHEIRREMEEQGVLTPEIERRIDQLIDEQNENMHTSIEEDFLPYLRRMREGDLNFLNRPKDAGRFFHGLAVQYMRTNHVKGARRRMTDANFARYEKIANVITLILSANIGFSMYVTRGECETFLLENLSHIPFVTGDQPAINLATNPTRSDTPTRFDLYYPLSHQKAFLLLEPESDHRPTSITVTADQANMYNLRMAAHSYRQVLAQSPPELQEISVTLLAFLSAYR
jgi:Protein of unknown function (DUF4238)